jgi:hypothetical protein
MPDVDRRALLTFAACILIPALMCGASIAFSEVLPAWWLPLTCAAFPTGLVLAVWLPARRSHPK